MAELIQREDSLNTGREKLNNAIKAFNETVVEGDSSVEAAQARVDAEGNTYSTLKERLDSKETEFSSQLAEKANKEQVHSYLSKKRDKSTPIGLNDVSNDLLGAIQGGEGTSFELLSIPRDYSVTPEKTSFINKSSNIFDKNDIIEGKIINVDGEIVDNANYAYSGYISVVPGKQISSFGVYSIAWYDNEMNFVSRLGINYAGATIIIPDNVFYMRVNVQPNRGIYGKDYVQINRGSELLPYEEYYLKIDNLKTDAENMTGFFDGKQIMRDSIGVEKAEFVSKSTNLLNVDDIVLNKNIAADGTIEDRDTYAYSHEIYVEPHEYITAVGVYYLAFYDADGNFISRYANGNTTEFTTTIPENVYYMRATFRTTAAIYHQRQIQINRGSELLPYEEYYLTINKLKKYNPTIEEFRADNKYILDGNFDGTYKSPQLNGYENVEEDWLPDKVYTYFDNLMNDYPNNVSKATFGKDSSDTYDVNYYEFKPEEVPTISSTLEQKLPKVILVAGYHGYEKTHSYVLYEAMKQILEDWQNDESLEALRWNVHFIVVPCANPYSFLDGLRTNANGVDLSRNFEYGWDNATVVDGTSKGEHPLSEVESQYLDSLFKEHAEDTIFFSSLHNFSSSSDPNASANKPNEFIWYPAANQLQAHVGKKLVSKMSRLWKKSYSWLEHDPHNFYGYVDRSSPLGSEGQQANLYGIQGGTFETSRIMQLEDNPINSSSNAITMATETLINLILLNVKYGVDYYNNNEKVKK